MNKKHNRFRSNMSREQFDQLQGTEIKSKRTRFGKVFALGANRFQAVTYTDPVHRFNEKTREWDEMDNRFSATPRMKEAKSAWKQGIMPAVTHGDILLECKTGSMDVACAMSGEAPFINLTDAEGRHLAWGIKDALSILPEADDINDAPAQNVRGMREKVLDHLHGEVTYNGIFAGVDLRCKLDRGFKDELVFAEKESIRPISFLLESEGRQMELNKQNMLIVKDEQGKAVFQLQPPFMLDADEQRGEVAVQLEACENGIYAMTYLPDDAFIETATFPVVLDPEIQTEQNGTSIVDTYIREGYTTDYSADARFWVTATSYYGKRYGLLRIVDLPEISSGHFITGAHLHLKNYNSPAADGPVFCSEVLTAWEPNSVTYADMFPEDGTATISSLYQDYCIFPEAKYTWQTLDVTTLARKWYLGENNGVILTPRTSNPITIQIQSSDGSAKPYFTVNYASLAGLESYLTYDSQSAGLAGSGSVSLVNGNLIFAHGDTAMDGNRMPVSITHYYNSCNSDVDEFGLGYGWRTSVHQTLHKEYINEEVVYVYTDGDGTEHWFEVDEDDSTQYVDMSGLSLTLTVGDDGKITITSKGDGRMIFPAITDTPTADAPATDKVLIENIYDAIGNKIIVTARTDKPLYVSSVTDGADRVTSFVYAMQTDGSLKCTAIKTPWQSDTACTRLAYTDGCLTTITHEDNRISTYLYEDRNDYQLLIQAQGTDGLAVRYEYSNTGATYGLPHCITHAEAGEINILSTSESVRNAALYAAKVTYDYGNHLTLVTDNISGKTLRYHFNDNGNQISIDDGLGYAVYTEYDQSDDNANTPINHATTRSRMQRAVKNLLLDPMIEEGSSVWEKSTTGTFTRDQTTNQWGLVSYKVKVPADGEAYVRQAVTLKPGQPYTLSAYMKSAAPKALVRAAYTINGETKYFTADAVPVDANASDGDFKRVSVSFTLPASADATVYCEAIGMTTSGYFWFDCMQLEEGLTCNHFNLLQNSDFLYETSGSTVPTAWAIGDGDSSYISIQDLSVADDIDGKMAPEFLQGSKAARLAGRYNRNITLNQDFRCYGNAGDRFTAGGWCKSFAKKLDEDGYVFCSLSVYFTGGSTWYLGGRVNFNYGEDGWQFASGSIVAPYNYTKVRFSLYMNRQMNHADFTGLYLYPEAFGTDYVYDAKGNRKKAIQLYGGVKKTEYDDHDNMIQHTAPGHTKSSTFGYGADADEQKKHLLRSSCSPLGTEGQFSYDARGNAKRSDTTDGLSLITRSTSTYQHNDNYVRTTTDARGKTVTTEVDADKGITTKVIDPKDQAVEYTHDTLRRVTEVVTQADGKSYRNNYVYDSNRGLLTSVKHNVDDNTDNDVVYSFEYDALGRKTKVKVGDTTLSENVYQTVPSAAHYGTLSMMKYGNDTVVRNEYDEFNRVIGVTYGSQSENSDEITFESQPRYAYDYNANGQVAHVTNAELNYVTESEYDLSNRPCRIKTHKVTTGTDGKLVSDHIYTGEVAYEKDCGRLSEFREQVGSTHTAYTTSFGYDEENRPTSLNYGSYGTSTLEYDGLGRLKKATVETGSSTANVIEYTYVDGANLEKTGDESLSDVTDPERLEAANNAAGKTSTTGLVQKIDQTGGTFEYQYDDNGNITSVKQDGVETAYTYDALGQLTQVDDEQENATWKYEYDQGGNIKLKSKFSLNSTSSDADEIVEFKYDNTNWRDQLTSTITKVKQADGSYSSTTATIEYDPIGNPLNDGTWRFEWVNGRQLARIHSVDNNASFVYNENGLRVQKTVNGVLTKYTLYGKNIVHMTQGSNELHFFYDAKNKPAVVVYNGTPYSYVKNLQGDIVAILNSAGTAVVNYVYDAWGRPISKTGSMAGTLGTVQPFRYRGYVFDEETGLYYLGSRYYDSALSRFINADSVFFSKNLYCYCSGRPISSRDATGQADETLACLCGATSDVLQVIGVLCKQKPTQHHGYGSYTTEEVYYIYLPAEVLPAYIEHLYFEDIDITNTRQNNSGVGDIAMFATGIGMDALQFPSSVGYAMDVFTGFLSYIDEKLAEKKEKEFRADFYQSRTAAGELGTGVVIKVTHTNNAYMQYYPGLFKWITTPHHSYSFDTYELSEFANTDEGKSWVELLVRLQSQ